MSFREQILTFAYFSTEWDMDQPFSCLCGTERCLGTIKGAKDIPSDTLIGLVSLSLNHPPLRGCCPIALELILILPKQLLCQRPHQSDEVASSTTIAGNEIYETRDWIERLVSSPGNTIPSSRQSMKHELVKEYLMSLRSSLRNESSVL